MATVTALPKITVEEVNASEVTPLRLIVFGSPKVGKTTLALSFPRPFIINTDEGLEGDALKSLAEAGGKQVRPEGLKDLDALYLHIRDHSEGFDSIILDSGDELVEMMLFAITKEGAGARSGSASGALGQTFFDVVPEQAEYLAQQRALREFLTKLRKLRKHMVITFGERQYGSKLSFNTSPGLQAPLFHWASVLGRLMVAPKDGSDGGEDFIKGQRILLTNPASESSLVGSRYSAITPYVVQPTFDKLWDRIEAAR